jgi:hypothetical protein
MSSPSAPLCGRAANAPATFAEANSNPPSVAVNQIHATSFRANYGNYSPQRYPGNYPPQNFPANPKQNIHSPNPDQQYNYSGERQTDYNTEVQNYRAQNPQNNYASEIPTDVNGMSSAPQGAPPTGPMAILTGFNFPLPNSPNLPFWQKPVRRGELASLLSEIADPPHEWDALRFLSLKKLKELKKSGIEKCTDEVGLQIARQRFGREGGNGGGNGIHLSLLIFNGMGLKFMFRCYYKWYLQCNVFLYSEGDLNVN